MSKGINHRAMNNREEIKRIFERFEYDLLQETDEYLVYAAGHNLYLGVEIVSFIDIDSKIIKDLVGEYRAANYSVRLCPREDVEKIEDYLFDWFFQVELSNKKISIEYQNYANGVMQAYAIKGVEGREYKYITCPYSIERNNESTSSRNHGSIVPSLQKDIASKGIKFIIVEAPAGYGKTSTAMELLNSYADEKHGTRPFFMSLSKDRQAPTFYYLLVSQINKTFNVRLGDDLVIHYIKAGRIPLIIDGFDELLSEDLDKGDLSRATKKGITMLSTIAELLHDNAKIILTTRKTAVLSGQEFLDWYQRHFEGSSDVEFVRYKLELPQIEDWLDKKRVSRLTTHIQDISNPVLLGYLHYLSDTEFDRECKSEALIENYVNRLLEREIDRQNLPFTVEEQKLIFERLAAAYAYEDLTADTRNSIKDVILLMSSDLLEHYATLNKDSLHLANTLTNHALLDRKSENTIGFVNDFVMGVLLGYAMIDERDDLLPDYYKKMSPKFIEKVILSMSANARDKRELVWLQLLEKCALLTPELRFLADARLLHRTSGRYNNAFFDGYQLQNTSVGNSDSQFTDCHFVNIDFKEGEIEFDHLENCTFINCVFNRTKFHGNMEDCDFYECIRDGVAISNKEQEFSEIDEVSCGDNDPYAEMLSHYVQKGGKGRRMQLISYLKKSYNDSKDFKKIFAVLCTKKYVVTNGDKSHITSLGMEYLKTSEVWTRISQL